MRTLLEVKTAVTSLVEFGVSAQADLVYRALVAFGPWSIGDISSSLGLPARRVRRALDELSAVGATAPVAGGRGATADERLWRGRSPDHVVKRLRQLRDELALARERLEARLTRMGHPSALGDPSALGPSGARALIGIARARLRLAELSAAERHEHLAMNPERAFSMETVKAAAPLNRALLERGIAVRTIGVAASAEDMSGWHDDELTANGLDYRELPEVSTKMIIFDRKSAFLPIEPGVRGRGFWEITEPEVVARLVGFFNEQWAKGSESRPAWTPPTALSMREKAIVVLLATGRTDASIAEKLDLSVRTIAYTVSGLMERYDVTNRLQLGLKLGEQAAIERREVALR